MPIYMRITRNGQPVIMGDVTAKGHEKWIELASAQLGQSRSIANSRVGSPSTVSEIVITKSTDSASTALFRQSLYGEGVTIQIDFVKPGSSQPTYLTITLQNALISSYQLGAGPSDGPMESMALNFTKLTFDLPGTGPDVSGHAEVLMRGWNFSMGAP